MAIREDPPGGAGAPRAGGFAHGKPRAAAMENALSDPARAPKSKRVEGESKGYYVYILRCADGSLYTGYARDPQAREKLHNDARGARYTAGRRPVRLVYAEECDSLSAALRREHQLKRWTRAKKEALIVGDLAWLKGR